MDRFKKSVLNSISSLFTILVNSIFSLILGRIIIKNLGSDYNGVNATITQLLTILTLVEGGFTTASIVSLFKPYTENDFNKINDILTTTSKTFKKIAFITLFLGTFFTIGYSFFIKSSIDETILFVVFIFSVLSATFNLYYVNNYKILFQVSQNEYIINFITTLVNIVTQVVAIIIIVKTKNIVCVRFVYLLSTLLLGFLIVLYARKKYTFIDLNTTYDLSLIKGTKDVIASRFTSVIYSASPVFFLSVFVNTIATSIFATYNSVINIVKNCIYSVVNAPQNALGQLLSMDNKEKTQSIFIEYEYLVFFITTFLLSVTFVLIIPFVKLYTASIADINYIDPIFAILLVLISFLEIIHIPSGIIINMSGNFKIAKYIQIITCIILLILNLIGAVFFGVYGLMMGTLLTNVILASMEIIYTRKKILNLDFKHFYKCYFPLFFISFLLCSVGVKVVWRLNITFFGFILIAFLVSIIMFFIFLIVSFIINKKITMKIFVRLLNIVCNKS